MLSGKPDTTGHTVCDSACVNGPQRAGRPDRKHDCGCWGLQGEERGGVTARQARGSFWADGMFWK